MAKRTISWKRLPIRGKVTVWVAVIAAVMIVLFAVSSVVCRDVFNGYDRLFDENITCYQLQEALDVESRAFQNYAREASQANRRSYEAAVAATGQAVAALPFDYSRIGQERYARTWNILNGYEGYCVYRDQVIAADPDSPDYTDRFYRVVEMQEALADYALRLTQVTLEEGNEAYESQARIFSLVPLLQAVLAVLALVSIMGIFRVLSNALIRPLLQMARESRRIAVNDFSGEDIPVTSEDEVGELTAAFNRMKGSMGDYIATLEEKNRISEALHREELEKLELERNLDHTKLEMLKSQVNPHFLFNTLNMISCMARLEEAETTDRMILSLGNLFRYNLRTKEQEVYLEQEIEALDDYIYIQQMRFDGRISYRKLLEVDPGKVKIPAFTLQPVVENAFAHGLAAREEGCRITLRIWEEGGRVTVSICDNGRGMSSGELARLREKIRSREQTGQGIGLGNISSRIFMLYPEGDVRIYSRQGRGTVIQFVIPQNRGYDGEDTDCGR